VFTFNKQEMPIQFQVIPIPEHKLLDLARRQGSGDILKDALAPFAFFVLLRWYERQEREEEAIALFDEREHEPLLSARLCFSALELLDSAELFQTVYEELLPRLADLHGNCPDNLLCIAAQVFDPKKLTEPLLYEALRLVAKLPFETADDFREVDKTLGKIIKRFIEATRYAGEFITPTHVARIMLDIAAPQPGESIYDPCFGMGSLLAGAASRVVKAAKLLPTTAWADVQNKSIYGVEMASVPYLIGMTRVVLAGINSPHLAYGNTLERDRYSARQQFDVVLAAPPIGGRVSDRWHYDHFPIRSTSSENLFLQHIMESLKPNGRAVVALPEGFLFRGGVDEQVRERLFANFSVEAVISLPAGTLLPYTGVKPNLLVFRRANQSEAIWFQEAHSTGKSSNRAVLFNPQAEAKRFRDREENENGWLTPAAEIAESNFDLTVKRRQRVSLETLFSEVAAQEGMLDVVPLEEIADVISGIGYTRSDTTKVPTSYSAPLIRVTELTKTGELKPSPLFLTGLALERAGERRLQTGDILVSTQGTIGKVGIVREAFADCVPAHGITTIRLKPASEQRYSTQQLGLAGLLRSEQYQQWLIDHASGTTIKNIPVRALRQLPLLLVKPEMRETLARLSPATSIKPKDFTSHIAGLETDAIWDFLIDNPIISSIGQHGFDSSGGNDQLQNLASVLMSLSEIARSKPSASAGEEFPMWLSQAGLLVDSVVDAYELPSGSERLAMLEIIQKDLDQLGDAPKHPSVLVRADLTLAMEAVKNRVVEERERILSSTQVSATLEPAIIEADKETEITVRFRNNGGLPLRKISIETSPILSQQEIYLLRVGEESSWTILVPPRPTGTYPLSISWTALRIDNSPATGEVALSYSAHKQTTDSTQVHLEANPYVVGNPLESNGVYSMFYGRGDIIDQIRRSLRTDGPSTVLLLEGNRRAGKTSVLYRLRLPEMLAGWIPVYCSFQRAEGSKSIAGLETNEIFYQIARELVLAIYAAGYEFEAPGLGVVPTTMPRLELRKQLKIKLRAEFDVNNPFEQLDMLMESLGTSIGDKRIVLLLDEFDKIQEGIDNGVTSPQVPENLRSLFHTHNKLSGILTGAKRIKHLRENHWSALYGIGVSINVSALDIESARKLVTQPVEGRLAFAENARDQVLDLCNCQPFFIQSLCYRIFEQCAETNERNVTLRTVEAAAQDMVEDNEHFVELFDHLGSERRRYLTCLVDRLSAGPDRVSFDLIFEELEKDGVVYDTSDLAADLKHLQELDVLDLEKHELGTSYKIKIPLFSRWLTRNVHDRMHRRQAAEE
jgi:type I restriction enzyme M protein